MVKLKIMGIMLFGLIIMNSCGGGHNKTGGALIEDSNISAAAENELSDNSDLEKGETVYKKFCYACHQMDGSGVPGMYPPLKENKQLGVDNDRLIGIVLNGLTGELEVNGETYDGVMVGYSNLSDEEVASVINYIKLKLNSFSNVVSEEDVKRIRNK